MINRGISHTNIAKEYCIRYATVSAIRLKREKIIEFFEANSEATSSTKQTGAMIQQKAQELNEQLKESNTFNAILRWEARFRQHHILPEADIGKDLKSRNQAAADIFKAEFHDYMQEEGYRWENVYNAETTGLLWKAVPETTLLSEKIKSSKSEKHKDQFTTFLCSNATGSHKLPVLTICAIQDPPSTQCFSARVLSIMHRTNTNPIMDSNIFNEWFNKCFLKSVTERQHKNRYREKTLLLLHNSGRDHENRIIRTKDEFVKIMYFSSDIAPLIQPMNRGIIACFKRMFRIELLESLMPTSNSVSEEELIHIYFHLKMDNYCNMVRNAWSKVKNPILKNAWDKLLKDESEQSPEDFEIIKRDTNEALEKLNRLPGCRACDSITVMEWFETDKKHNDMQVDINNTLIDFLNVAMDREANKLTDENFEDILDLSPK